MSIGRLMYGGGVRSTLREATIWKRHTPESVA